MSGVEATRSRLLDPKSTAAVVLGAHDWTEAGLGQAPSFLRSASRIVRYIYEQAGLGLDPELVLNLFDDTAAAGDQLARVRDTLDLQLRARREAGRPITDLLVYYIGHGQTNDQGHLSLLVRRSRRGLEAETGIKAPDLARTLRLAAPQQRRSVILDCCFSEAAVKDFIGMSASLSEAVAATAAKDLTDDQPGRGTLLLCSSPIGEVSMGAPNSECTLFTGTVLEVLHEGDEGLAAFLSFADLRDAVFNRMLVSFGANAPRPMLHQVNQARGDLTRAPAFPNRAAARLPEDKRQAEEADHLAVAWRRVEEGEHQAEARFKAEKTERRAEARLKDEPARQATGRRPSLYLGIVGIVAAFLVVGIGTVQIHKSTEVAALSQKKVPDEPAQKAAPAAPDEPGQIRPPTTTPPIALSSSETSTPQPPALAPVPPQQIMIIPSPPPQPKAAAAITEPEMIFINGSSFLMGSNDDRTEQPIHKVNLPSFWIAKYPVTVRQWRDCVDARGCSYAPVPDGSDDTPLSNISWTDAQQYVTWLSQATHLKYRLPTEAEWEYAARSGVTNPGVRAEWVADCWFEDYRNAPPDGSARLKPDCETRVQRGGSGHNVSYRWRYDASVRYESNRFRVARSVSPEDDHTNPEPASANASTAAHQPTSPQTQEPEQQVAIKGIAGFYTQDGWPNIDGHVIGLIGIKPVPEPLMRKFILWVTAKNSYLDCEPAARDMYRCFTDHHEDVARSLLRNGEAQASDDADAEYLDEQQKAKDGRRGGWGDGRWQ